MVIGTLTAVVLLGVSFFLDLQANKGETLLKLANKIF